MRLNRFVYLTYQQNKSSINVNINIPFNVKKIRLRQAAYSGNSINLQYITLSSDLWDNQGMSMLYNSSLFSSTILSTTEYTLPFSKPIQGSYNFYLNNCLGQPYQIETVSPINIILLLEFNSED
jgi:hypothetical protein